MKLIEILPPTFKVDQKVVINELFALLNHPPFSDIAKLANGKTGKIIEIHVGRPAAVDDNNYLVDIGSASFYTVELDEPFEFYGKVVNRVPAHDSELLEI